MSNAGYIIKAFPTKAALTQALAEEMTTHLDESIDAFGRASWAVSGGSTPIPLFAAMQKANIRWHKVCVSLVDDRWVDESHSRSNAAMVKANLLQDKASSAEFLTLYQDGKSPFDCADAVSATYDKTAKPFTSILLGMGPDGHTASLFPDAEGLEQAFDMQNAPTISPIKAIKSDVTGDETLRLTLSARAIASCDHLRMMLVGQGKLDALNHHVAEGSTAPIARLLRLLDHPLTVYYAPE